MKYVMLFLCCCGMAYAQLDWFAKAMAMDNQRQTIEVYELQGPVQAMSLKGDNVAQLGSFQLELYFDQDQQLQRRRSLLGTADYPIEQLQTFGYLKNGKLNSTTLRIRYDQSQSFQSSTSFSYGTQGLTGFWLLSSDDLPQRYVATYDQLGRLRLLRPSKLLPQPEVYTLYRYDYQGNYLSEVAQETWSYNDQGFTTKATFDAQGLPVSYETISLADGQVMHFDYQGGKLWQVVIEEIEDAEVISSLSYSLLSEELDDYGNWIDRVWQGDEDSIGFSREISYFEETE